MGVMTLVAVGLAILFALPAWVGFLVGSVIGVAWVAFLVAGAFFGRAIGRTFCIGAIAAHLLAQTGFGYSSLPLLVQDESGFFAYAVNTLSVILADSFAGWVCVRARRYWEQRDE